MSNRRINLSQAKSTLMSVALGFIGVFEFLEGVDAGESKIDAAKNAYKRSELRGKAIKRASKSVAQQARKEAEEDES